MSKEREPGTGYQPKPSLKDRLGLTKETLIHIGMAVIIAVILSAVIANQTGVSRGVYNADMARMEQNKSVVLTFIDAMSTSNAALADTCVAPDAFTVAKGYGKFAGVRTRETMIGTIDAFKELLPTGLKVEVKSVTADGNVVVVEFEGDATTREGKPYQNQYCMVFMLADGKIKQVNEYFCNVHADEVLWPLVEQHSAETQ